MAFTKRYELKVQVHYSVDGHEDSTEFIIHDVFCEADNVLSIVERKQFPHYGRTLPFQQLLNRYESKVIEMNRVYDDDQVYIGEIGNYVDQVIVASEDEVWFVEQAGTLS